MSQGISYAWETPAVEYAAQPDGSFVEPLKRPLIQPMLLLVPALLGVVAWLTSLPILTDLCWVLVAFLCGVFLIQEMRNFTVRFGIGGVVLYAGVLIWFCYDYFDHWFLKWSPTWSSLEYGPDIVATSTMCHMIFIACMAFGIQIRWGRWFPRLMTMLPEPASTDIYFWIVIGTQVIGLFPYAVWNSESFVPGIYHAIVAGRAGGIGGWLYGRSGNANVNFGAYIAQILQIGEGGSLLAGFCAIFLLRSPAKIVVCWCIWFLWLMFAFGTGARGEVAYMMVPIIGFFFIKYHVEAAASFRRISIKAYVALALLGFMAVVLIQVQIRFRNEGFTNTDLSSVTITRVEGNSMFSEGLRGFLFIPSVHDYFYNTYPGEAIVMPIPNAVFWCLMSPVPHRAIFRDKPNDPAASWYNDVGSGGSGLYGGSTEGVTITEGLVGYWYYRFGFPGVVEGGLFMGWLMGVSERALANSNRRPMAILFSLGFATWVFRCYRILTFNELNTLLVGMAGITMLILFSRIFTGPPDYRQIMGD